MSFGPYRMASLRGVPTKVRGLQAHRSWLPSSWVVGFSLVWIQAPEGGFSAEAEPSLRLPESRLLVGDFFDNLTEAVYE